jgi:Holliday junction resolvase
MKHDFTEPERRRLLELAREYRKLGYAVIIEPTEDQLPDFLATLQPDMIANNKRENVVFAVKSQRTLPTSLELKDIAQAVQGKKDWRFELVVTNPREKDGITTASDSLLNRSEVLYRLQEAQHLSEQEHGEAAFLLVWSAAEAVLRRLVVKAAIAPERDTSEAIAKNLFAYGLLDKEQYETLVEGVKVRNSLMHGYQNPQAYAIILNKLLHITEQLLKEEQLALAY